MALIRYKCVAFRRLSTLQYRSGDSVDYIAVKLEPLFGKQLLNFRVKVGYNVGFIYPLVSSSLSFRSRACFESRTASRRSLQLHTISRVESRRLRR
jgi:hypothetical protein